MRCILVMLATGLGPLVALLPPTPSANAQPKQEISPLQPSDASPPPGTMMWQYECNAGTQCPTTCTINGNPFFQTSDYATLTITQIPNRVFWVQLDTGDKIIDYLVQSDVVCSITGAVLKAARARESASSDSRPRQ